MLATQCSKILYYTHNAISRLISFILIYLKLCNHSLNKDQDLILQFSLKSEAFVIVVYNNFDFHVFHCKRINLIFINGFSECI